MSNRPFVLASNRGPVAHRTGPDGDPVPHRGAGGLVSGIGPLLEATDSLWVAAAMTDADRAVADRGVTEAAGWRVALLDIDPRTYRASYDVVCNQVLWFLHHGLYDRVRGAGFDAPFDEAWVAYRQVNESFADAIAELAPADSTVLIQDYHLALVGSLLSARRGDLRTVHFSHTPFAVPSELRILPDRYREELLASMAATGRCGFHSPRWARAFEACCAELGLSAETFVSPLASDLDDLRSVAAGEPCRVALAELEAAVGDRAVIARVDRIEPSKNLLRGFEAYDRLLTDRPEWHDRVVFVAALNPSREGLASYRAYRQEVETRVQIVNERHGTPTWRPIRLDSDDDFPRSVALMRRADVMLVNPVRDGLNLVAAESSLLNERDSGLVLSTEAGIHDALGELADTVNPFDIGQCADALDRALRRSPAERAERAARVREVAESRTPADWLADQLATP